MRLLIIGGGRMGQELMASTPKALVVEANPRRLENLRDLFGEDRVIEGPWKEEHLDIPGLDGVVAATHEDERNINIALTARGRGLRYVVVKVKDPARVDELHDMGFEDVICPHQFAAKAIRASLTPRSKDLIEIPIFPDSPHIGKRMEDLGFGLDAIVVGVVRNGSVIRAEGLKIEVGDHIIIVSIGWRSKELQRTIVRKESRMRPFESITVLLAEEEDLNSTMSESLYMARIFDTRVDIVSADPALMEKGKEMARVSGAELNAFTVPSLDLEALPSLLEEWGIKGCCIALRPSASYRERRRFSKWRLYRFLRDVGTPVLICRRRHPYQSVLNVLDEHPGSAAVTELVFKLGFLSRARLRVLRYGYVDPREQERLVERLTKLYGVRCSDEPLIGNPTLEFVSELTSGNRDLTVLNWNSQSINIDILGRAIMEGPSSLLLMRGD